MSGTQYRVVKVKTGEYRIQSRLSPHSVHDWNFVGIGNALGIKEIYETQEEAQKWIDRQTVVTENENLVIVVADCGAAENMLEDLKNSNNETEVFTFRSNTYRAITPEFIYTLLSGAFKAGFSRRKINPYVYQRYPDGKESKGFVLRFYRDEGAILK